MEYLEGASLKQVVRHLRARGSPLVGAVYERVILDLLTALEYAHDLKEFDGKPLSLVHRDVNPDNVMVVYGGHAKLLDFGIAKAANSAQETQVGVLKGKLRYMAPEQMAGDPIDRRADLFAVGGMLWDALTGRRLWEGMKGMDVMSGLVQGAIAHPRTVNPRVSEELDRICMRALAFKPAERYPTAGALRADLEKALGPDTMSVAELAATMANAFELEQRRMRALVAQHVRPGPEAGALPVIASSIAPSVAPAPGPSQALSLAPPLVPSFASPQAPSLAQALAQATTLTGGGSSFAPSIASSATSVTSTTSHSITPSEPPPPSVSSIAPPPIGVASGDGVSTGSLDTSPGVPSDGTWRHRSRNKVVWGLLGTAAAIALLIALGVSSSSSFSAKKGAATLSEGTASSLAPAAVTLEPPAAVAPPVAPPVAVVAPSSPAVAAVPPNVREFPDHAFHPTAAKKAGHALAWQGHLNTPAHVVVEPAATPAPSAGDSTASTSAPQAQAMSLESDGTAPAPAASPPAAAPASGAPAAGPQAAAPTDLPKGTIAPAAVVAVVRSHAQEIQHCFDPAQMDQLYLNACESMGKTPAACRRARVIMAATVAPDGRVTQVSTSASREGTARLEACIRSAVQTWSFPEPAGGVPGRVSYPFVFE